MREEGVGTECSMLNVELSGQAANDVSVRFIRSTGLSCLSQSSNHTHETDRRNQIDQIPATRREMDSTCVQLLNKSIVMPNP